MTIVFNKPYGVLSRFTDNQGRATLKDFIQVPGVYPVGRLDQDSEGLLLVSDEPRVVTALTRPGRHTKVYWVQVEREPAESALAALARGVLVGGQMTRPARVKRLADPGLPGRSVPIRHRLNVPACWLEIELSEGRNRQVRRMTAAVGHPTLRLVRVAVGQIRLGALPPGTWRYPDPDEQAWLRGV